MSHKHEKLRHIFGMFGIKIADLLNNKYPGTFNDSNILKFESFAKVYTGEFCDKLNTYLLEKCNHALRDKRTPQQYGTEIIRAWLIEDCVDAALTNRGASVQNTGCDSDREFYDPEKLQELGKQTPDLKADNRHIEIVVDWNNYWERKNQIDLRINKVDTMFDYNAILLGIVPASNLLLVIDFNKENRSDWKRTEIKGYGKTGYTKYGIEKYLGKLNTQFDQLLFTIM